jgi:uncharacterized protein YqeY
MSQPSPADLLRARIRAALTDARRRRDSSATNGLRAVLAAIDNAEASEPVQLDVASASPFAGSVAGLGAGEVERRLLDGGQLDALVGAEVAERRRTADHYDALGRPEHAIELRAQAEAIARIASAPDATR